MTMHQPTLTMEIFRQQLLKLIEQHTGHLDPEIMLGVTAYAVGQMIAMQDSKKYKPIAIMRMVQNNIELGNKQAIELIKKGKL